MGTEQLPEAPVKASSSKYILDAYCNCRGNDSLVDGLLSAGGIIGSGLGIYYDSIPGAIVSIGALVIVHLKENLRYKNALREAQLDFWAKGRFSKLEETIQELAPKDKS